MKRWIVSLVLLVPLAVSATSQSKKTSGLNLSGAVILVSPILSSIMTDQPFVVYDVALLLQLRNDGSIPLIVFTPGLCEKKIEFLSVPTYEADEPAQLIVSPWVNPRRTREYSGWASFVQTLAAAAEPPKGTFLIIEPGKVYEFRDSVTLNDGFSLEIKPAQTLADIRRNTPISEFGALRIEYHLSLKKKHADDGFLRTLQEKWKRYGHLVLDTNGDFTIRSETILNRTN
jgi:hypothetical protein